MSDARVDASGVTTLANDAMEVVVADLGGPDPLAAIARDRS